MNIHLINKNLFLFGLLSIIISITGFVYFASGANAQDALSLTDGLVAYWNFNDGSGNTSRDSINGHHGILNETMNDSNWVDGVIGKALEFDNPNYSVEVPHHTDFEFGIDSFSISGWYRSRDVTVRNNPIGQGGGIRSGPSWHIGFGRTPQRIFFYLGSNSDVIVNSQRNVESNIFYHVVLVIDRVANQARIYIDGKEDSSIDIINIGDFNAPGPLQFGRIHPDVEQFIGTIDEVGVWRRALTEDEILILYSNGTGITYSFIDEDKDRYSLPLDCDDSNSAIFPNAPEICDGLDNQCPGDIGYGEIDENLVAPKCENQVGVCSGSVKKRCGGNLEWLQCEAIDYGPDYENPEQSCDNLDNDCDAQIDEGFDIGASCTGLGICGRGIVECAGPTTTRCSTMPGGSQDQSQLEFCNLLDENCNGKIDDNTGEVDGRVIAYCPYTGPLEKAGIGECREATMTCSLGSFGSCAGEVLPTEEICDNLDNDCDGEIDNMCKTLFKRGDTNQDGEIDISDPVYILIWKFLGSVSLSCQDTADVNDDGNIDTSDAIYELNYLFTNGKAPPEPYQNLGYDSTQDELTCESYNPPEQEAQGGGGAITPEDILNDPTIPQEIKDVVEPYAAPSPTPTPSPSPRLSSSPTFYSPSSLYYYK